MSIGPAQRSTTRVGSSSGQTRTQRMEIELDAEASSRSRASHLSLGQFVATMSVSDGLEPHPATETTAARTAKRANPTLFTTESPARAENNNATLEFFVLRFAS